MAEIQEVQIQSEISKLLLRESKDRSKFIRKVEHLAGRLGDELYPSLLFTTAHLEFEKRTAKRHWKEVLRHWERMSLDVKREIDFRVALLDYFIDVNRRIRNPKIIRTKITAVEPR